jgi:transcriptional regulator with XRE-family HTH domain
VDAATLIRSARAATSVSQRALARASNVPQPSISDIERGVHDATVGLVERLLRPLGAQIIAVPTTRPTVAQWADAIAGHLRHGRSGHAYRSLVQVGDDLLAVEPALRVVLTLAPPAPTGDRGVDAYLAALVDQRLTDDGLPVPHWVDDPGRTAETPWFVAGVADSPELVAYVRANTPEPFARRGVWVSHDDLASV